jgi:hypothetical protein
MIAMSIFFSYFSINWKYLFFKFKNSKNKNLKTHFQTIFLENSDEAW